MGKHCGDDPLAKLLATLNQELANIEGRVVAEAEKLIAEFLDELGNPLCPMPDRLQEIIDKKNRLMGGLKQLESKLVIATKVKSPIEKFVPILNSTITAIPLIPAILPAGVAIKAADVLASVKDQLKKLQGVACGFDGSVNLAGDFVTNIEEKFKILDNLIQLCAEGSDIDFADFNSQLNEGLNDLDLEYKGFTFEIQLDTSNTEPYPKRFAVARDIRGIIVLKSEPSFASRPEVLIDELKFVIDRDDLKAE